MKTKFFIAAAALFCGLATNVNAQEAGKFRVGVGAGVNLNSISNNPGGSSKVGFNVGVKGDYFFTDKIYLGTGLFFNQKNASVLSLDDDNDSFKATEHWNYIEIPLHFGYRHPISDNFAIFGEFGPYFAYAVSAKLKAGGASVSLFSDDEDVDDTGAKRFNAGLGVHAGVEISNIQIRLGYDFGLTKLFGGPISQKTGTFTIGAAYCF